MNRRAFLVGGAAALVARQGPAFAQSALSPADAPSAAERGAMADAAQAFMRMHGIPGLGVAIVREGRLAYDEAFGFAETETGTTLTPAHRFRIASVSKPITAAAVFRLIETGRLAPDDRVFGAAGILGDDYGQVAPDSRLAAVTVEHLLTHTAGGWPNDASDPMFQRRELDHAALIAMTLRSHPLTAAPGTVYAYSNFGYCVLGRIIEKVTRRAYAAFVLDEMLTPAGAAGMEVAGNTLADHQPLEVRYYGRGNDDPYGQNVRRMDSHGGWIARASSLALFASAATGLSGPALLTRETVAAMTAPSAANPAYARGWSVNRSGNWWHTGSLAGTAAIMVRTRSGFCWAGLVNTRQRDSELARNLDRLLWTMARAVPRWRA